MDYKKIAIIGGATLGAGALLYYFMNNGSKTKIDSEKQKQLQRDVIIKTLQSLKKELFTVCMQMNIMAEQMKQYSGGQLGYDIKEFILSYPTIQQEIQSSINKAYNKNNVTEAEFQYNCEVYYASDKEISTQMKEIKSMVDDSAEGKKIDIKTEIPDFLTQEKLLQIIKKIMIETTKAMQLIFVKIKQQHGELNLNDPRIARQLQTLEADSIKDQVFKEYNLEDLEENPQKVVSFATQKYSEQPSFQQELMNLELKQRKSMESIMKNPENPNIVDDIFDEPAENMGMGMGMGMGGGQFPGFHSQKKKAQPTKIAETTTSAESSKADPFAEIKKEEEKAENKEEQAAASEQKHHDAEEKKEEVVQKVEENHESEKAEEHVVQKSEEPVVQKPEEHTAFTQIEQSVEVLKEKVEEQNKEHNDE